MEASTADKSSFISGKTIPKKTKPPYYQIEKPHKHIFSTLHSQSIDIALQLDSGSDINACAYHFHSFF